jgi:hypothetical protein
MTDSDPEIRRTPPALDARPCGELSPGGEGQPAVVACNRVKGHDGPHQLVRDKDFAVLLEWTDGQAMRAHEVTRPETDAMFEVPDGPAREKPTPCRAISPNQQRGREVDRCNRLAGHDGPHRVVTKSFKVLAQWG